MVGEQENLTNNQKKLKKMDERLSSYLRNGMNVLDVGAGEAWAMKYFKERKCNYYAIEAQDRLASSIHKRGGEVIGKSIFENYSKFMARFDIIICRHILEHLLNPGVALSKLKYLLSPRGVLYLALPNALKPSIHKGFRTSFIRPVHVSYFCEDNVLRLSHSVGLSAIHTESIGEIFCLLKHGVDEKAKYENCYSRQKQVFLKKNRQAIVIDAIKIIRDLQRVVTNRIKHPKQNRNEF